MKNVLRVSVFVALVCWTTVESFAQTTFDGLPSGFPTDDVSYQGDNQFTSPTFGNFTLDTTIHNRVIHSVLGPMVWAWDETTEMVTLHTEWWGDLYTYVPTVAAELNTLGFSWPYVKSEITNVTYFVNVLADFNDPLSTPFYNHREIDGEMIGWQHSIGVDLDSASNYYLAAETLVGQMQSLMQQMVDLQGEYIALPVSVDAGQEAIDAKFTEIEAVFFTMHSVYTKFVFYYHRCTLSPIWAERLGRNEDYIQLANAYVDALPTLGSIATQVYSSGQEVLYVNCVSIKQQKTDLLNALIGG